jgi:hypothetical protein
MAAPKYVQDAGSRAAGAELLVNVIFTETASTMACLKRAAALAEGLNARIRLIVPRIVPYALPLDRPAVSADYERRRFRVLAGIAGVEVYVQILYGREPEHVFQHALGPHSLVLIGGGRRWWPSAARRFRKRLESAGHQVIFVETGGNRA